MAAAISNAKARIDAARKEDKEASLAAFKKISTYRTPCHEANKPN